MPDFSMSSYIQVKSNTLKFSTHTPIMCWLWDNRHTPFAECSIYNNLQLFFRCFLPISIVVVFKQVVCPLFPKGASPLCLYEFIFIHILLQQEPAGYIRCTPPWLIIVGRILQKVNAHSCQDKNWDLQWHAAFSSSYSSSTSAMRRSNRKRLVKEHTII